MSDFISGSDYPPPHCFPVWGNSPLVNSNGFPRFHLKRKRRNIKRQRWTRGPRFEPVFFFFFFSTTCGDESFETHTRSPPPRVYTENITYTECFWTSSYTRRLAALRTYGTRKYLKTSTVRRSRIAGYSYEFFFLLLFSNEKNHRDSLRNSTGNDGTPRVTRFINTEPDPIVVE